MNDDTAEAARQRKRRSRAHVRGEHRLCLPGRCPDAPQRDGGEHVTTVTPVTDVTVTSNHGAQHPTITTGTTEARHREVRALELSADGWSLDRIAAELGYADRSGAFRAVSRALSKRAAASVEELRAMADAELEVLRQRLYQLMELPGIHADTALKAINQVLKVQERRSRLHGLDAGARGVGAEPVGTSGHKNNFAGPKGFFLVVDGAPVRDLLPYGEMTVNANPGAHDLQPPVPAIVINPATLVSDESVRSIITGGGLILDGGYFSIPAESISALLITELRERTGPAE
ncbi:hypothetical protein [Arthrobacter sp.]|uniref:hypothetical protein n=1 Tax=Arthrobacter sp. TaxID=1667 RepID=UPI002811404F|nr:hypothetical protein [Arthrobacter sp.]